MEIYAVLGWTGRNRFVDRPAPRLTGIAVHPQRYVFPWTAPKGLVWKPSQMEAGQARDIRASAKVIVKMVCLAFFDPAHTPCVLRTAVPANVSARPGFPALGESLQQRVLQYLSATILYQGSVSPAVRTRFVTPDYAALLGRPAFYVGNPVTVTRGANQAVAGVV